MTERALAGLGSTSVRGRLALGSRAGAPALMRDFIGRQLGGS